MHRKNNDARLRGPLHDLSRRLNTVEVRHGNIHDDNVRISLHRLAYCLISIGCLSDNTDVGLPLEREPQPFTHDRVIICYQYLNGHQVSPMTRSKRREIKIDLPLMIFSKVIKCLISIYDARKGTVKL